MAATYREAAVTMISVTGIVSTSSNIYTPRMRTIHEGNSRPSLKTLAQNPADLHQTSCSHSVESNRQHYKFASYE